MRIVVFGASPYGNAADPRSDHLLAASARALGHAVTVVSANERGSDDVVADVVLVRADLRSEHDLASFAARVAHLETRGLPCLPSAAGLCVAEDKRRTDAALRRADVGTLPTHDVADGAPTTLPLPVALKTAVGWGGLGVRRCASAADLAAAVAAFRSRSPTEPLVVQPWIDAACSTVQVAGDVAVAAFVARRGGGYDDVTVPADVAAQACAAVRACGLRFGSVDVLLHDDGPAVIDVNSMPGLDPDDAGDRRFARELVRVAAETVA